MKIRHFQYGHDWTLIMRVCKKWKDQTATTLYYILEIIGMPWTNVSQQDRYAVQLFVLRRIFFQQCLLYLSKSAGSTIFFVSWVLCVRCINSRRDIIATHLAIDGIVIPQGLHYFHYFIILIYYFYFITQSNKNVFIFKSRINHASQIPAPRSQRASLYFLQEKQNLLYYTVTMVCCITGDKKVEPWHFLFFFMLLSCISLSLFHRCLHYSLI